MAETGCRRSARIVKTEKIVTYTEDNDDAEDPQNGSQEKIVTYTEDNDDAEDPQNGSQHQLDRSLTDLVLHPKSKKIARPPNAFMVFAREHRKLFAAKYPSYNNKDISTLLGKCWKEVDPDTKKTYFEKATLLDKLHKEQYPDYSYSPRIARMEKEARLKKSGRERGRKANDSCGKESTRKVNKRRRKDKQDNDTEDASLNVLKPVPEVEEQRPRSPGYVPNNPSFFTEPEHRISIGGSSFPYRNSQSHSYHGFPESYPAEKYSPMSAPCQCPENHEPHAPMYSDPCYLRSSYFHGCMCFSCEKYRNYCPEPANWNSYDFGSNIPSFSHPRENSFWKYPPMSSAQFEHYSERSRHFYGSGYESPSRFLNKSPPLLRNSPPFTTASPPFNRVSPPFTRVSPSNTRNSPPFSRNTTFPRNSPPFMGSTSNPFPPSYPDRNPTYCESSRGLWNNAGGTQTPWYCPGMEQVPSYFGNCPSRYPWHMPPRSSTNLREEMIDLTNEVETETQDIESAEPNCDAFIFELNGETNEEKLYEFCEAICGFSQQNCESGQQNCVSGQQNAEYINENFEPSHETWGTCQENFESSQDNHELVSHEINQEHFYCSQQNFESGQENFESCEDNSEKYNQENFESIQQDLNFGQQISKPIFQEPGQQNQEYPNEEITQQNYENAIHVYGQEYWINTLPTDNVTLNVNTLPTDNVTLNVNTLPTDNETLNVVYIDKDDPLGENGEEAVESKSLDVPEGFQDIEEL